MTLALICACFATGTVSFADDPVSIERSPSGYMIPEGSGVTYTVVASGNVSAYEWYIRYDNRDYPAMPTEDTASAQWRQYVGSVTVGTPGNQLTLNGVKKELDGAFIYCIARGEANLAVSSLAPILVGASAVPGASPVSILHTVNTEKDKLLKLALRITEEDGFTYEYTWYSSHDRNIENIKAVPNQSEGDETSSILIVDTSVAGTYYYCCMVSKSKNGKVNRSYSALSRVNVNDPSSDPGETLAIDITKAPAKLSYTVGEKPDISGMQIRSVSGNGYGNVDGAKLSGVSVFPNYIYGRDITRLTVTYDDCGAAFPVVVSAAASGQFGIVAVSDRDYVSYMPGDPFALEAAAVNANSGVEFKWYESDENGTKGTLRGTGTKLSFPSGFKLSEVNKMYYYLCVAECDGKTAELLFTASFRAPDSPEDTPEPDVTAGPQTTEKPDITAGPGETAEPAATVTPGSEATDGQPATADVTADNASEDPGKTPEATGDTAATDDPGAGKKSGGVKPGIIIGAGVGLIALAVAIGVAVILISRKSSEKK